MNFKSLFDKSLSNASPKSRRSFYSKKTQYSGLSPKKMKHDFMQSTEENIEYVPIKFSSQRDRTNIEETEEEEKELNQTRKRFEERRIKTKEYENTIIKNTDKPQSSKDQKSVQFSIYDTISIKFAFIQFYNYTVMVIKS